MLVPLNVRLAPAELQFCLDDAGAAAVDEDGVCEVLYTSGTTGAPKGVMLTHRGLHTHAVDSALSMGATHRDVVLHTIPLFHVNGWGTPHWVTALGGRHVMLHRFDPDEVLGLIEREGVTRLHLVPTMAVSLLACASLGRRSTASLVNVTVGGAAAGPELLADLVMLGYWNRPDETARALRDGWLRTGDLATVDAEGYVTVVDRREDVIISDGENVSSVPVELVLCAHPSVREAAVVAMPDERWGEVPRAFVVLHDGAAAGPGELVARVRDRHDR